jgi:hypothetical protein
MAQDRQRKGVKGGGGMEKGFFFSWTNLGVKTIAKVS